MNKQNNSTHLYDFFEKVLVVNEFKNFPKFKSEILNSFLCDIPYYQIKIHLLSDSKIQCRICLKSDKKETTFKKVSHIIPEFLGNKFYLSNYECDSCNSKYGKLEEKLKKFLSAELSHMGIRNTKKAVNQFNKNHNGTTGIYDSPSENAVFGKIRSEIYGSEPRIFFDEKNKQIKETVMTEKFIPYDVFLAFCKIGLLMLPESELQMCNYLRELILKKQNYMHNIIIKKKFLNLNRIRNIIHFSILKQDNTYILIFALRNYIFEIFLPMTSNSTCSVTNANSILKNDLTDTYISLENRDLVEQSEKELYYSYEKKIELEDMNEDQLDLLKEGVKKIYPKNEDLINSLSKK